MRHLTVLLVTGLLAGTASASIITSDPSLDLTVTGQNLQYADIFAGLDDIRGPGLSVRISVSGLGNGSVFVKAQFTSYVTITGGTGRGTMIWGTSDSDPCNGTPFDVRAVCDLFYGPPSSFTFGVQVPIFEQILLATAGPDAFGVATAHIGPLIFGNARDSDGNPVNATVTFSATPTVSNPEPGTWALLAGAGAMLFWFKRRKSGASGKRCPARALSA